jgi:hypothetical protein
MLRLMNLLLQFTLQRLGSELVYEGGLGQTLSLMMIVVMKMRRLETRAMIERTGAHARQGGRSARGGQARAVVEVSLSV